MTFYGLIENETSSHFELYIDPEQRVKSCFSTRIGGGNPENKNHFLQTFANFFINAEIDTSRLVHLKQVHGNELISIDTIPSNFNPAVPFGNGDALATNLPGVSLAIKVADCLSVQLFDPASGVIANIHNGWRSAAAGIVRLTIEKLAKKYSFNPHDAVAALLPAINRQNYKVGEDVYNTFLDKNEGSEKFFTRVAADKWLLDIRGFTLNALTCAGIKKNNIYDLDLCTFERADLFHSFRRDGNRAGRMLSVILKEDV